MLLKFEGPKQVIQASCILGQNPLHVEGVLPVKEFDDYFLDMGYAVSLPEPLKYKAKLTDREDYIELEAEFFGNVAFRCCECEKIIIRPYNKSHVLWLVDEDQTDEFDKCTCDADNEAYMENEDDLYEYENGKIDLVDALISGIIWMKLDQAEMDESLCAECRANAASEE